MRTPTCSRTQQPRGHYDSAREFLATSSDCIVTAKNKAPKIHTRLGIEMRKQNMIVLWPIYFDSTKTRMEGRRVPKSLAKPSPNLEEIRKAVERLGLRSEAFSDATHPSAPWQEIGLVVVSKKGSKNKTIRKIAKEMLDLRG